MRIFSRIVPVAIGVAVLACLNQSGDKAFLASDDAISSLITIHLQRTAEKQ